MGLFKVTIGVMGASKSMNAITNVKNLRYQGLKVLVGKPKQDDRDGDKISSRLTTETIPADMVIGENERIDKKQIIENNYDCIIIDESHMLSVEAIEDLYEITATSDTDVHLYGLVMSWKGKPFLSTAMALAYADKIEKIEVTDRQKNLLTHHIKKVGNMPCDITQEGGEIETGDIGQEKYTTVSKQTFYQIYGMLGQLHKPQEDRCVVTDGKNEILRSNFNEPDMGIRKVTRTKNKDQEKPVKYARPMPGHYIKLTEEAKKRLRKAYGNDNPEFDQLLTITSMHGEGCYTTNLVLIAVGQLVVREEDFTIFIDGEEYQPKVIPCRAYSMEGIYK